MNASILNTEIQKFIDSNIDSDTTDLVLKGTNFANVTTKDIIEQIEAKKRCKKKLPTWFTTKNIYYPNKLNIEQTSSEITAGYKANLVSGQSLIDLTGGFGIDAFYFSKQIKQVTHCEINESLSNQVKYNYKQLEVNNVTCYLKSGIEVLKDSNTAFDWIYLDPSRRDYSKGKVFLLKDCLPSVPLFLNLFFKYSKNVMVKTSPLLDISSGIKELNHVKTIHIIAVNNEVKELLWILERDYNEAITIETINLKKKLKSVFSFKQNEEAEAEVKYSQPQTYLYEPNVAILKAGAFNTIAKQLKVSKLHKHSHLYTSNSLIEFPGRRFKIEIVTPYNKKRFKRDLKINKANVTVRNFPETVQQIREKLSLKDGGNTYLFFTTNVNNNKIVILTHKVN